MGATFSMAAGYTLLDSSSISTRLVMVDMKAGSVPVSCTAQLVSVWTLAKVIRRMMMKNSNNDQ